MITLHEGTLSQPALSRFLPPSDEPEAEVFDFDDELETACSVIAQRSVTYGQSSAQSIQARRELAQLVAIEIRRVQMFEIARRIDAVSDALRLSANAFRTVAA